MNFGGGFGGYQSMDQGGYGGGGFMQDGNSPMVDSSQEKKKYANKAQSLIPCTVAMLQKASYSNDQDSFKFGETELHQVTFVGIIREVQESATNLLYKIDDMTADSIIVRKWIENDENQAEMSKRSECREDTYVRVCGHLKSFQDNKCSIIAFSINPIKDFNEITYHMLDVIHAHLSASKAPDMMGVTTPMATDMRSPRGGMTGGLNTPLRGGMGGSAFGGGHDSGLSVPQQQVLDTITACTSEQGIGLGDLRQRLRGLSDNLLRSAIEFLSNEGHIYSTIDDEHYRSTAF